MLELFYANTEDCQYKEIAIGLSPTRTYAK